VSLATTSAASVASSSSSSRAVAVSPPSETPLMPEPAPAIGSPGDALSLLYLFEDRDQDLGVEEGTSKIASLQAQRNQEFQKETQAIAKEDEAAKHRSFWDNLGSLFSDIAKVAGVVASIAAAVCSFGAATPIAVVAVAGAILSSASLADGEFHILQKLGVDPSIAGDIDLGMSLAGAACSMGAGMAAAGQSVSDAASAVSRVGSAASGAATVVQGASDVEAGEAQSDEERADADQVVAQAQSDHDLRLMQIVIDELQSADEESKQMLTTIANAKSTLDQTATDVAISVRG
jgi:hypothetical protein